MRMMMAVVTTVIGLSFDLTGLFDLISYVCVGVGVGVFVWVWVCTL